MELNLNSTELQFVCNVSLLEHVFLGYPLNVTELSQALCGTPVNQWYDVVLGLKHGRMQVYYVGLEVGFEFRYISFKRNGLDGLKCHRMPVLDSRRCIGEGIL